MLNFQREVESNQKLYESFLQRVKETNETQNLQVSNIQLIEMPNVPIIPISPNLLKNSVSGYLMSLFAVFCIVLYRSLRFETIVGIAELNTLNKSTMGYLPRVKNIKKGFHLLQNYIEDSESGFSESEIKLLNLHKFEFKLVSKNILRAETAPVVIASLIQNHFDNI